VRIFRGSVKWPRLGAEDFGGRASAEQPKGAQHQRWGCGLHCEGRLGDGDGLSPPIGPERAGFVSALIVPQGNAADNGQLVNGVLDHWERTGVLPQLVSSDDGYSSRSAREDLLATGVRWSVSAAPKERKLRRRRIGTGQIIGRRGPIVPPWNR